MKFTKKDYSLINHALDILSSDYDPVNPFDRNGKPEKYRVKMQENIEKLRTKLLKMEHKK